MILLTDYQQDIDIDWDADLFAQLKQSGSTFDSDTKGNESQWDVPRSNTDIQSMRKRMKQSWGEESNKEKSATTDWMPGCTEGPDQDEPWFTG
ncbi:hypothetical protein ACHAWO_000723 [Cyclotella atomus]|uniref:Uncharacterized protein n=1 Tax=Cyclotella atomus TaxID=382360 RepID=A0ABD3PG33_9STRA